MRWRVAAERVCAAAFTARTFTAQEALNLSKQRYKLGLGSIVEVTQSEVAVTGAQTRLAEAQYEYKTAEVTLAYATGALGSLEGVLLKREDATGSAGPSAWSVSAVSSQGER